MGLVEFDYLKLINTVEEKISEGGEISRQEAEILIDTPQEYFMHLIAAADRIRIKFKDLSSMHVR